MATSGPGATNLVTGLADAKMDSVPIVAITGQVPSHAIGTDAFQEADGRGITCRSPSTTTWCRTPATSPRIVEAFHLASTGRPGPVLIDVPKDVHHATTDFDWPGMNLPGYQPPPARPAAAARGRGADRGRTPSDPLRRRRRAQAAAAAELAEFVENTGIPVATTLKACGAFPDSHPQNRMPGMHGTVTVTAMQKADLLLALGVRFDDRVTGKLASSRTTAVVHVDIDASEINKNKADVPIVGDVKYVRPL